MNFLKKIFSTNKTDGNKENREIKKSKEPNFEGVYTTEYFDDRYSEDKLSKEDILVDGSIRMISGYYLDNKIKPKIDSPIYHPLNLDQVVQEDIGFYEYCKLFKQEDKQIGLTLTIVFSLYMSEKGFKLYKDKTPEFPLRFMTLKYDNNGGVVSLYPFEYTLKVLNGEATYSALVERVDENMKNVPTAEDFLNSVKKNLSKNK